MSDSAPKVTAAGIARLAGVGRAAVSNWRRRHPDFPRPVGGTGNSPVFSLVDVERWLRAQGKLTELPLRERAWQQVGGDAGAAPAALVRAGEALLRHADHPTPGPLGELADEIGPAEAYAFLLGRHLDVHARRSGLTPRKVAVLMAALAGPAASVLDPACGPGTLLAAAEGAGGRRRPRELYGHETDATLARLAALRLALRADAAVYVRTCDALRAGPPPASGPRVDAVLCHPPFGQRDWGHDELAYDPRWEYGLPARGEPELAWVQHALARLRPGGAAVLLMPPAAASRRTGRRVRSALLRRGALRAVIALPAGAAPPYNLPLHLWVLRRPDGTGPPVPRLLLVDTGAGGRAAGARRPLPWEALHATALDAWRAFGRDGTVAGEPGAVAAPAAIDLLDDDVDLDPARRIAAASGGTGTAVLTAVREEAARTLHRSSAPAPAAPAVTVPPVPGMRWSTTTIGELARTGALAVHSAGTGAAAAAPRPGDVVVPLTGDGAVRVVEPGGGGEAPDRGHCLLRPDPQVLDPWFVAGFLHGTARPGRPGGRGGRTLREEVQRLRLPRLPLAEQRRYGRRFRELAAFKAALRRAAELGEGLVRRAYEGLSDGTVDPE